MQRAQSTSEYIFLIALVAAAFIAILVYAKRGFQGNWRQLSEQVGAGYYDPRNTTIDKNTEKKHTRSVITSSTTSTVAYGPGGSATSSGSSINTETGNDIVVKTTDERLGDLSGDTWKKY